MWVRIYKVKWYAYEYEGYYEGEYEYKSEYENEYEGEYELEIELKVEGCQLHEVWLKPKESCLMSYKRSWSAKLEMINM